MNASTWLIIAIVAFSLSGVAAIVAIVMFFRMNIPAVIGDLSGKTVAREIQAIREERSSDQPRKTRFDRYERRAAPRTSGLNTSRIAGTGGIGASRRLDRTGRSGTLEQTPVVESKTVLEENQTTVLEEDQTTVLEESRTPSGEDLTTVLAAEPEHAENATTVLEAQVTVQQSTATAVPRGGNATMVLGGTAELTPRTQILFEITRSVMLVQSAEVIR